MIEADPDSISDGVGDIKLGMSDAPRERVVHSFVGTQIQPTAILSKADKKQPTIPKPRGASKVRRKSVNNGASQSAIQQVKKLTQ